VTEVADGRLPPRLPALRDSSVGRARRFDTRGNGNISFMLTILLLVLLVVLLLGGIGPRYYRGRGRRTVVREYETDL
jgi:hypothetical protein